MADAPPIRYADCDGTSIAFQVFGDARPDLVFVQGGLSHLDLSWDDPRYRRMMLRLASFARVTILDKRGMGASDPTPRPPTLEERMQDVVAVMDAAGIAQAAVLGLSEGATSAALLAARHPERVRALVLCSAFVGGVTIEDDDTGFPVADVRAFWERVAGPWKARFGQGVTIELFSPDHASDERALAAMAKVERLAATPATWRALIDGIADIDVRPFLGDITAPTLVLHRRDEIVPIAGARYLAAHIPGARLVEVDGNDHLPWLGDTDQLLGEIEQFLTGGRLARPERRLATVLFTDIVGSTERAAELGDRRWRALLEDHDDATRGAIERSGGRLVKTTGDGALALFDAPASAVECAREAVLDARRLGLALRAGVHAGECEITGEDVAGIAVHVGARIAALAAAGEVLVSSTVKELVTGSDLAFEDRGEHELKGVPAAWRVYALL